jgi:MFS family permease
MAAVYALYILFIPLGARIISRYGYEHGIFFSIPFQILYWVFLFSSQTHFNLIYLAPVAFAIEKALFWPAFHADVARFAQDKQRGREFSVLYAIVNVVYIVGPFIGGAISETFGVRVTFILASVIYFCSFIPLFTTKEVFVPKLYDFRQTWELYKTYPKKFLGYLGFGEELLVLTVWPIFIYAVLKDYSETGSLVTIATLVATILALYIGKVTDQYSKRLLVKVGAFLYFLVWIARFVASSFWSTFAVESLSRTSKDLVFIPLSTLTYERANETHIMPYVVFFEQSLSVGKLVACLLGILLFTLTGSFYALFILAGLFSLLYMFI